MFEGQKELLQVLSDYNAAADKFIAKVETGRARSVETYADLKACRAKAREVESCLESGRRAALGGKAE